MVSVNIWGGEEGCALILKIMSQRTSCVVAFVV